MWAIPPEEVLQVQRGRHRERADAATAHRAVGAARARDLRVTGPSTLRRWLPAGVTRSPGAPSTSPAVATGSASIEANAKVMLGLAEPHVLV